MLQNNTCHGSSRDKNFSKANMSNNSLACVRRMSQITYYYEVNHEISEVTTNNNRYLRNTTRLPVYCVHANNDDRIRHTPLSITYVYVRMHMPQSRYRCVNSHVRFAGH